MNKILNRPSSTKVRSNLLFSIFLALAGIAYIAPKIFSGGGDGVDFRVIWVAGKIWSAGQNPYSAAFLDFYNDNFGFRAGTSWVYPPYWYPIAVPISQFPFPIANLIWKALNLVLLIGASFLSASALENIPNQRNAAVFAGGVGVACFLQATPVAISIGQTSILVYFGISAMVFGLLKARSSVLIIGLSILALKPNFGIVFFAAVFVLRPFRWCAIAAGGVCLLSALPAVVTAGIRETIGGFLSNVSRYSVSAPTVNLPPDMTGISHLLDYYFHLCIWPVVLVAAAMVLVAFTLFRAPTADAKNVESVTNMVARLILAVSLALFFIPLHSYDFVVLAWLAIVITTVPLAGRWLIVIGLIFSFRAGNLAPLLGIVNPASETFRESLLISLALVPILLGAIWSYLVATAQIK